MTSKSNVVRQNGASLTEAEFYAPNQKSLPLPVQKLWPIICLAQKWWPWPCPISDFQKKKFCIVACAEDIFCNKIRTIGSPVDEDRQTDKQTNKQTAVTNILCENRQRFRKVMKAARRAGTLRNRWNCNFKNRDDNVMRAADDKIRADDDLMRISNFSKLKKSYIPVRVDYCHLSMNNWH